MYKLEVYLFIFVTLFVFILRFGQRRKKIKGRRKVDNVPTLQWTGFNLPVIVNGVISFYKMRKSGVAIFAEYVNKGLKFVKCAVGPKLVYIAGDADIFQKVLKSTALDHLQKPKCFYDLLFSKFISDGLLASSVDIWVRHRKSAGLAFTYKSLGIYLQYINQNVKDLVDQVSSLADQSGNGSIDNEQMTPLLDYCMIQLITQIIMGSECASFSPQEMSEFHEGFRTYKEINVERFMNPVLLVPPIWWVHPKRRQLNAGADAMYNFAVKVITGYRNKSASKPLSPPFPDSDDVDSEIPANITAEKMDINKNSIGNNENEDVIGVRPFGCIVEQLIAAGLPDKEITDEVGTLLAAGHETVRVAMDMFIFQMAAHPECQRKCQVEIDQLLSHSSINGNVLGERDFTMDDLSSLKYLERCVLESLRLTPTVPFYGRELGTPLEISKECTLDAGSIVVMAAWGVHRDPIHYPNPDVFDPDRFLAENVKKRHPYSFAPFSMGARNCIGWKLALMEMKVFMAWILRYFNLSTTDGLHDVKILFDITIHPERPYDVTFQKRVY